MMSESQDFFTEVPSHENVTSSSNAHRLMRYIFKRKLL